MRRGTGWWILGRGNTGVAGFRCVCVSARDGGREHRAIVSGAESGAIAYYLAHQAEVDAMLASHDREFERLREQTRTANPDLYKKLEETQQQTAGAA